MVILIFSKFFKKIIQIRTNKEHLGNVNRISRSYEEIKILTVRIKFIYIYIYIKYFSWHSEAYESVKKYDIHPSPLISLSFTPFYLVHSTHTRAHRYPRATPCIRSSSSSLFLSYTKLYAERAASIHIRNYIIW